VQQESYPLTQLTSINSIFIELANFRFRPENWKEFAHAIIEIRRNTTDQLIAIKDFLNNHFCYHDAKFLVTDDDFEEYSQIERELRAIPSVPKVAVDEWGLVSNPRSLRDESENAQIPSVFKNKIEMKYSLAAQKYIPVIKILRDYTFSLSNFLSQAKNILAVNAYVTGIKNKPLISHIGLNLDVNKDLLGLSVFNLTEALEKLSLFQDNFNKLLAEFCDTGELNKLIAQEKEILRQIWRLWYFFAYHPEKKMIHPSRESKAKISHIRQTIRKQLNKKLKNKLSKDIRVSVISETTLWEEDSALWIEVDVSDPLNLTDTRNDILDWVAESIAKAPNSFLREMFLKLNWKYLVIIPLICGKSIDLTAWKIPIWGKLDRKDSEVSWTSLILQSIPKDAVSGLNLQSWNLPKLETGIQMIQAITIFQMGQGHLRHINYTLENIDSLGMDILQEYLLRFSKNLSEPLNLFLSNLELIKKALQKVFKPDAEEKGNLQHLIEMASGIEEFVLSLKSENGNIELNIKDMEILIEEFGIILNAANLIYQAWIRNIIQDNGAN
jgi:hypothetical protein